MSDLDKNTLENPVDDVTTDTQLTDDQQQQQQPIQEPDQATPQSEPTQEVKDGGVDILGLSDEEFEEYEKNLLQQQKQIASPEPIVDTNTDTANNAPKEPVEPKTDSGNTDVALTAEQFVEAITTPFKANGKDVKVTDPEDIKRLMQMGLNYNLKMSAIKPHLRVIKSLEKAGLLDDNKINYVIDLMKHDPKAIAQLIKESAVDTYSLPDLEQDSYTPKDNLLPQETINFQEKIKELNAYASGKELLTDINSWDEKSIDALYANPQLLDILAQQKETQLYQDTMSIIIRDKALGKIPDNASMLDVYNYVGGELLKASPEKYDKKNQWNTPSLPKQQPQQQVQPRVVGNSRQHVAKQQVVNNAKSNAQLPNGTSLQTGSIINPSDILHMRDEDFEKFTSFDDLMNKIRI